ncbi:hypothetical protein KEM55_004304 [Ascosphaera atra]|nr:hypothetical protein KEM55_004304 [Ascosphaera atra]
MAHRVPGAAGDVHDRQLAQRVPCVRLLREPVKDLAGDPVPRTRGDNIVRIRVNILRDNRPVPSVLCLLDLDVAVGSREDGLDELQVNLGGLALAAEGVDEDLDALAALGAAVGEVQEARAPGVGGGLVLGVGGVVQGGGGDDVLGALLGVLDGEGVVLDVGPEDVEVGDCSAGGFGGVVWVDLSVEKS